MVDGGGHIFIFIFTFTFTFRQRNQCKSERCGIGSSRRLLFSTKFRAPPLSASLSAGERGGYNRSSSIRLELSVGHVVRVCESPCVLRACGRPAHSNLDLTVASNIAQEHRPTSVQRMRYCWTARMVYKFTPRSFPRLYIHTYKIHDQAEHCPIRLQAWADSQLAIGGWSYRGRERITV